MPVAIAFRPDGANRRGCHPLVLLATLAVLAAGLTAAPSPAASAPTGRPATQAPQAPGFGEPGTPVRPASERYVREAYRAVLGRDAEAAGLTYWGERLDGTTNRGTFARHMVLSNESVRAHIATIYDTFGRAATTEERNAASAGFRAGRTTPEALLVDLLASEEYRARQGGEPEPFVRALYTDVLGRSADQAGLDHWLAVIRDSPTADAGARTVAKGFVFSLDRLRPVVTDAYDRVLARSAEAAGRDFWAGRIRRGESILDVDRFFLASNEAWSYGCSILDRNRCLLPFPNDQLTLPDPSTDTGKRVVLKSPWVPAPVDGPAFDPTEWNRQDGFSPGSAILVHNAGIDPEQSGLPPLTDIGSSLDDDAPTVLVDTATGERVPHWAELDANAEDDADRALVIRPARNLLDGHTYAVGIGEMSDASGAAIAAPSGFRIFRDEVPSASRRVNDERASTEVAIDEVVEAGLDRDTLHLAWTFTVASTRNLAERAVHMRDEALGGTAGQTPADFTVTKVEPRDDATTRVEGTFEVPNYMTGTGAPGSRLNYGDDDLPETNGTSTAPFVCTVPDSARTTPARASLYGHGLLGTGGQANSGYVRDVAREHNIVFCGTDYVGMSDSDLANTVNIISDFSRFPQLVDRNQQGLLNFQILGRLMTLPDGLASDPSFQGTAGIPAIDPATGLAYYGLSQGGIMGGALVALSTEITRGVLGVPAINYSTLLERSVDFDPFFAIMAPKYPSALDRITIIGLTQMLWDRGEGNGYANHVTTDPLPGSPTNEVLLHVAFGDHQVAQIAADVQARTYGARTNDPPLAEGRVPDVTPLWGIDRITTWPHAGSATIYWDSGTPAPPIENLPNRAGEDPHSDPREDPDARVQISEFLKPGGTVVDVCDGTWCEADGS